MFTLTPYGRFRINKGFHLVSDNWNDYGFYTLFKLFYIDDLLHETEIGHLKIGFRGQEEGATSLPTNFYELGDEYFSLGFNLDYYSNLRDLGDEVRIKCLKGLNDIAYNEQIYKQVINEEVVKTSLLRQTNIKTVNNQYRRIAHGGSTLTEFNFNFNIPGIQDSFKFEVIPESLPPTNIHTIIGTNGSGKTTTLKGIVSGYLNEELNEDFSNAIYISFSIFDQHNSTEGNHKDYYYVGAKDGLKTKSQKDLKREFNKSIYNIFLKKRHHIFEKVFNILRADYNLDSIGFNELLSDFSSSVYNDPINTDIQNTEFSKVFSTLSSGHQIILLSMAKLVELVVEKTLIIIDEPETHLHPPLLSAFVRAISDITTTHNAVAILATHSPVVLQEVPRSCVSIIRKFGSNIAIQKPRFETFGENVAVLTEEVFGLEIPKTGFHTLLRKKVEELRDYDTVLDAFNNELSIEAKSIIRTYLNELED
ncbi:MULTISPECIES: AAA family ATPase [Bacillus]|uniref:ABC-type transport system involved in cytochrome c biogenesis ATPase subunit n=1 Tax=Bacillus aerius TaxID=293388 RepID=A0ABR6B1R9_9BACI|nr:MULTISPECIES: AAA family ATPase [Bacillus]MBA8917970.1 ABC-type transport system involved in cytochrome c biogenesis ATPase subunit [Bacillus aerius]BDC58155.1 hypothetical protein NC3_11150 [Bacillus altitudinis]CVM66897.1 phage resistance endonuclease [Streptococcus pneumoniae]